MLVECSVLSTEVAKELDVPDEVWDRAIEHAGDILDQTEKEKRKIGVRQVTSLMRSYRSEP